MTGKAALDASIARQKSDDMLSRFDTVTERDGRMDGQNSYISISRVSNAVLTRDKGGEIIQTQIT